MKLHTRKSDSLSFIFLILSLSVLAYSAYTIIWPIQSDFSGNGPSNECLTDTLTRGKLPLSDTAYANALQRADMFLKANKPEACLAELEQAKKLRPEDKTLNSRIAQVRGMISGNKKKQADMLTSVVAGDAAFQKKDYLNAKAYYQLALNLFPTDSLVKDKLKKTMDLLRSQKAQNTLFDVAVANADRLFQAGEYDRAKEEYENASRLIPSEQYPKQKINEIIKIKVDQQFEDGMYSEAILNADKYYNAKNWQPALLEYQNAQKIRPQEKYPKDRIAELIPLIAAQRSRDEAYIKLIASADQLFSDKLYLGARKDYDAASKIKPDQPYPKNKIAEIDGLLAKMGKTQKDYEQYISLADSFYIEKNFIRARDYYTLASGVKPGENYPKEMLVKVKPLIAGQEAGEKAKEEAYLSAIAIADQEFISKNYEQAKKEYQRGLAIKPAEAYPKSRITTIDKIIADQQQAALMAAAAKAREAEKQTAELARLKKLDDDYSAAVKKGDSLLGAAQYTQAKTAFTEAAALKPAEAYPKAKLAQINTAQAELAKREALEKERLEKQQALDSQYQAAIAEADKLLGEHSLGGAKAKYTSALTLKPSEAYPKSRIAEIDKTVTDSIQKQKALDLQYAGLIRNADQLLLAKTYGQAKAEYGKASALKPSEEYPKAKISEIEKALADIAATKARDSAYSAVIADADKLLASKLFEQAKAEYQKALQFKADDLYVKTKIGEIDRAVAEIAQQKATIENRYKSSITKADQLLAAKSYEQAKAEYNTALGIKGGEQYPQDKIKEINTILSELKAKEDAYKASIAKADQLLLEKKFEEARTEYENSLSIKPNEQYPKNKVDEINKKLSELQGRKKTFDDLVLKGDNSLNGKDYGKAREFFQQAMALFPEETYPRNQLNRVNSVIDSIYRANKGKYDKAIVEADKFYNGFEFDKAIDAYTDASVLLPMENYPKEMITRIHRTIAENAIADVLNSPVTISSNDEKQFKFTPLNVASRKDNFIYIKLRNLSGKPFNVLLRYGKDKQPSGGVVIRNLSADGKVNERLISVREQDVWYRIDNDYISLYPQGGDIEVSFIQVSKAR